eukprot:CAMPEP_0172493930 /NCGR_PEP_ID=MMETSP1066-20121228/32813_1 /TAXON_ID=671091 /ORGANISM="Coscinodiscus wailesii, Strain CCMP2513" /LENGTH=144 /DNA_ID=CAMNT_0013264419 /DNA_START=84 /DNA_END=518 /DNA_ORIENTATION=-
MMRLSFLALLTLPQTVTSWDGVGCPPLDFAPFYTPEDRDKCMELINVLKCDEEDIEIIQWGDPSFEFSCSQYTPLGTVNKHENEKEFYEDEEACPLIDSVGMTPSNYKLCQELVESGCKNISIEDPEEHPYFFICLDGAPENTI